MFKQLYYVTKNCVRELIGSTAFNLASTRLSMFSDQTEFVFNICELSRAGRRRWSLFHFATRTGRMWWAQVCVCGITLTTTLEHNFAEDGEMLGPDFRTWVWSFNFFQPFKQESN